LRNQKQEKRVRKIERAATVISLAFLLLFIFQGHAECQLKSFVPTITDWYGTLEINSTYELNKNTYLGNGRETSKFDLFEKVTVGFGGFVYHPGFAIYNLSAGFGIQESYFKSLEIEGWDFGTIMEYDARILFLPDHKYSLELFSRRRNPYIQQSLSPGVSPVNYEHGINLYYDTRPLTLNLGYAFESLRFSGEQTDTHTLRFGAGHIYRSSVTRLNYTHIDADSTNLSAAVSDTLYANNKYVYKRMTLKSEIIFQNYDQDTPDKSFKDSLFDWKERLLVKVFDNLNASGNYNFRRIDRENGIKAFGETVKYGGGLVHRYYESINSRYYYSKSEHDATLSKSEIESHDLRVDYRKKIRYGVLYAAYSSRLSDTLRVGLQNIINESHEAGLFLPDDRFPLDETGVDESSISLNIVEPGTGRRYELFKDVHYLTETIGNQTFITIITVSGISPLIVGDGPWTFLANYQLPETNTSFETTYNTYSIRLELFDRSLSPYYSLSTNKQVEIEGEIPGGAEDSKTQVFGLIFHRKTITLGAEYVDVESRISPMTVWRIRGDYHERYSERTSVFIKTLYQQTNYQEGESDLVSRIVLKEDLFTLNSRANYIFPRRNITMFVGPSFSYRKSRNTSYGFGISSGLNWKMGLLNLNTGLSFKHLVSQLPDGDIVSQNIFFYFRAVRELF